MDPNLNKTFCMSYALRVAPLRSVGMSKWEKY